jgi:hypothetical protein
VVVIFFKKLFCRICHSDASDIPDGNFQAAKMELIRMRELLAMVDCGTVAQKFNNNSNNDSNNNSNSSNSSINNIGANSAAGANGTNRSPESYAKRPGAIPRSPPTSASASSNTASNRQQTTASDDPHCGLESRAGQEYWGNAWGSDNGSSAKNPTSGGYGKAGTDPQSFQESPEGMKFWAATTGSGASGGYGPPSVSPNSRAKSTL